MAQQPAGMTSDNGVILTLGLNVNGDRCAIVIPVATDTPVSDPAMICADAVEAFVTAQLTSLLAMLSSDDVYATFCQGEGMDDGIIPYREDYPVDAHEGVRSGNALPSQVAGLLTWYADPADLSPGDRIREAKNFIPGLVVSDVVNDVIESTVQSNLAAVALGMQTGMIGGGSSTWYRVLAAPRPRGTAAQLKRVLTGDCRGYVVTQRRRLTPRG
jgi:hypothetical protein